MNQANRVVLDSNLPNLSQRYVLDPRTIGGERRIQNIVGTLTNNEITEVRYYEIIRKLTVSIGDKAEDAAAAVLAMPALAIASDFFSDDQEQHKADAFFSCTWAGHMTLVIGEKAAIRAVEAWSEPLSQPQKEVINHNVQRGIKHANEASEVLSLKGPVSAAQVVKECLRDVDDGGLKFYNPPTESSSSGSSATERYEKHDKNDKGKMIFEGDIRSGGVSNIA